MSDIMIESDIIAVISAIHHKLDFIVHQLEELSEEATKSDFPNTSIDLDYVMRSILPRLETLETRCHSPLS